jgi:hypothetical protein
MNPKNEHKNCRDLQRKRKSTIVLVAKQLSPFFFFPIFLFFFPFFLFFPILFAHHSFSPPTLLIG